MFMLLDNWPYTGRSVFLLKFNLIPSSNDEGYNRLVICNKLTNGLKHNILIDTGAFMPVWAQEVELLLMYYPQAVETQYKAWLGGFGGDGREVPVWKIPRFMLSDGSESIYYENLHVAVYPMKSKFNMVVSFPMLRHAVVTYITPGNKCEPELQINCSRSVILTSPKSLRINGKEYMKGINIFTQGDYDISKLVNDPSTLIAVMGKHPNYEEWFSNNFPNGASSADEVLRKLEEEDKSSKSTYTRDDFLADQPTFLAIAQKRGFDCIELFDKEFPNGAHSAQEVLIKLG